MSGGLIFDEKTLLDGNIFKYEDRLHSQMNKYTERGALLTTYFSQKEDITTVDRGTQSIDELFGHKSPLRFSMIFDMPLFDFGGTNPENNEEVQNVEDINVEGDATVIPHTIIPKQYDFFIINHLKMTAVFEVTSVSYDSMKKDGFYKIHYRLHSTTEETIAKMKAQCVKPHYHCDLNAVGTELNPIISEVDYVKKTQVIQMMNHMIELYRAMYYNDRHNCFLFFDQKTGMQIFDMCGNEFMAKHGLMNFDNASRVIVLNDKIQDQQAPQHYAASAYSWLELGAPSRLLSKFYYIMNYAEGYPYSSFNLWGDGDIQVMQPIRDDQAKINFQQYSFFDETQFSALMDSEHEPIASEFEKLLWKFVHKGDSINLQDISLTSADPLISGAKYCMETYLMTPIMIYIIRKILRMG